MICLPTAGHVSTADRGELRFSSPPPRSSYCKACLCNRKIIWRMAVGLLKTMHCQDSFKLSGTSGKLTDRQLWLKWPQSQNSFNRAEDERVWFIGSFFFIIIHAGWEPWSVSSSCLQAGNLGLAAGEITRQFISGGWVGVTGCLFFWSPQCFYAKRWKKKKSKRN